MPTKKRGFFMHRLTSDLPRLLRFAGVGIAATLVHMGAALAAVYAGFADQQAHLIGFCVAFGVSFWGHFSWTFKSKKAIGQTLPRFCLLAILGYLLSALVLWGLQGALMMAELRLVLAICVIPLLSYLAAKYLIF